MTTDGYITAFAPASIGNVGVGFDMLGLAIAGVGDRVSARRTSSPGVTIAEVRATDGSPHPFLSTKDDGWLSGISVITGPGGTPSDCILSMNRRPERTIVIVVSRTSGIG